MQNNLYKKINLLNNIKNNNLCEIISKNKNDLYIILIYMYKIQIIKIFNTEKFEHILESYIRVFREPNIYASYIINLWFYSEKIDVSIIKCNDYKNNSNSENLEITLNYKELYKVINKKYLNDIDIYLNKQILMEI